MLQWKCACGHVNHATHDDPCEKCKKVKCECVNELLELHPLDKISLMSRLSGSLNDETSAQTSSDTKALVRNSIANMKHEEIMKALPHLNPSDEGHDRDGHDDKRKSADISETKRKAMMDWVSQVDVHETAAEKKTDESDALASSKDQEGAKKTPETSADEITVDIAESDNVNNDSSSGFARRLSNKIASSVVRSGLGL